MRRAAVGYHAEAGYYSWAAASLFAVAQAPAAVEHKSRTLESTWLAACASRRSQRARAGWDFLRRALGTSCARRPGESVRQEIPSGLTGTALAAASAFQARGATTQLVTEWQCMRLVLKNMAGGRAGLRISSGYLGPFVPKGGPDSGTLQHSCHVHLNPLEHEIDI